MDSALLAYLPMDRRYALATSTPLPERTEGSALFADISGFTPLTEGLTQTLGTRRGAEELLRHLNRVYDTLIDQVHAYGGSVIGFAGDAITCWFDGDAALRATACALAMQQAMHTFDALALPSGESTSLALKVAVASGPVRRFLVGNPEIQRLEVLAGHPLLRLAEAEQLAQKGEVLLDEASAAQVGEALQVIAWRSSEAGMRAAVVTGLTDAVPPTPWPILASGRLNEAQLRPWLLPIVYERLRAGQGEFLTELRPAVALFLRFEGLDYEQEPQAIEMLDRFICWVQAVVTSYEGTLLQLTLGDKGNYLYAAFGAPIAHEDDAARAVAAALELSQPPADFGMGAVQIGISQGTMRTGAYGGVGARSYGSLGDEVNLAVRLMQQAAAGQVLASGRIHAATEALFRWQALPAVRVKGKSQPIPLFALLGERPRATIHLQEPTYTLPMVGRQTELAEVEALMALAQSGQGQLVGITGDAGMGKSRLVAEVVRRATTRGLIGYGGECQSYGTNIPYLVWQPIWRALFELDATAPLAEQQASLARTLESIDPALVPRLPLLGAVLALELPDNELTRPFDAKLRKSSREGLLIDVLRAKAEAARRKGTALLLVLEDVHWLDPLSHDLLEAIGYATASMPLLLLLAYRPPDLARLQAPRVARQAHFHQIELEALPEPEMAQLIRGKLSQLSGEAERPLPARLLEHLLARAEGTPFYAEELLNYLHDQGLDPWDEKELARLELPTTLHSLVLSRIDQLSEPQKIMVKVASVIGRVFSFRWLVGYYPSLGAPDHVRLELEELRRLDLTPLEQPEPELTYLFKHIVTQEVAYESLPYERRATLHEQLAAYLEEEAGESEARQVELLAYHYERSENLPKKCEYLRRAGEAAQAAFANAAAIDYYQKLLPLLPEAEQAGVLVNLGEVLSLIGQPTEAQHTYDQALALAEAHGEMRALVRGWRLLGRLHETRADYPEALLCFNRSEAEAQAAGLLEELSLTLNMKGFLLNRMRDHEGALRTMGEGLRLAEARQDTSAILKIRLNMGYILTDQGRYAEAQEQFEYVQPLAQTLHDITRVGGSLTGLAILAYYRSDFAAMARYEEEALALDQATGDKHSFAVNLFNLALAYSNLGDRDAARARYEQGLRLFQEWGDKHGVSRCLLSLGNLAYEEGNDERACALLEEVLAQSRGGTGRQLADVLLSLIVIKSEMGALDEAERMVEEVLTLAEATADKRSTMRALLQRGRIRWLQGQLQEARATYHTSLRLALDLNERLYYCEGLAALAALQRTHQGASEAVVRRLAAVEAGLKALHSHLARPASEIFKETLRALRAELDEATFAAAWATGTAMTLEEAVAEALAADDGTS